MTEQHPLTDELCDQIVSLTPPLPRDQQDRVLSYDGRILDGMWEELDEEHKYEMRAAADWQLEQVVYAWEDAFQSDLEHGVRWLNDKAAKELATNYPKIFAFSEVLASMRPTQQEDNND